MKEWILEHIDKKLILVIAVILPALYYFGMMERPENLFLDSMVVCFTDKKQASDKVVFVVSKQRGLNEAEKIYKMGWPWRRDKYNEVINYLNDSGAKTIAFDAVFSEKSVYTYIGEKGDDTFSEKLKEALNEFAGDKSSDASENINEIVDKYTKDYKERFQGKFADDKAFANNLKAAKNVIMGALFHRTADDLEKDVKAKIERLIERYEKTLKEKLKDKYTDEHVLKKLKKTISKAVKNVDFSNMNKSEVIDYIRKYMKKRFIKKQRKKGEQRKKGDNAKSIQDFAIQNNIIKVIDKKNVIPIYFETKMPTEVYQENAPMLGNVEGPIDSDNTARRTPLLINYFGKYYPSLAFATAYHYLKPKKIEIYKNSIKMDDLNIPLTDRGYLRLKYYGTHRVYHKAAMIDVLKNRDYIDKLYKTYIEAGREPIDKAKLYEHSKYIIEAEKKLKSANKILFKELNSTFIQLASPKLYKKLIKAFKSPFIEVASPEYFKDKIILIGDQIPAHGDIRSTPFNEKEIGVQIHATAVDNLISNDVLMEFRRNIYLVILIFSLAILTYFLINKLSIALGALFTIVLMFGLAFTSYLLYTQANILVDTVTGMVSVLFTFIIGTGVNYFKENKEKKFIQGAFGQYLSPKVIEIIMDDPDKLNLGGERREITAFFSDVAGFSTISEALEPDELVHLLNEYLSDMCDITAIYDGVVDKFEGDAIIAFWGAPLEQPDHAKLACFTSVEMQERMIELRSLWKEAKRGKLIENMKMRVGLNSGPAVIGNMGSRQRMDYTMMGDTVNLAARLEGANKFYSTYTMISDKTFKLAGDFIDVRELDKIRVVGKKEPVTVYELLAKKNETKGALAHGAELYIKALDTYKNMNFAEAITLFEAVLRDIPGDGPAMTYIERCKSFVENPPPKDWDGVYTHTSKG